MSILDGRLAAEQVKKELKPRVQKFRKSYAVAPFLQAFLVGENPASQIYVRQKVSASRKAGIASEVVKLPESVSAQELKQKIQESNANPAVHAILVQLPLPPHLPVREVINWIAPHKDVDCLTAFNQARFWEGQGVLAPCTPLGIMELLKHYQIPLRSKQAVVVGRSTMVGLPVARLLLRAHATVTICHSKTRTLSDITRQADLVVVATGQPGLLGAWDFQSQAVVVDVGIHRTQRDGKTRLSGDVRFEEVQDKVHFITPVPGGVGPMTVAMLLKNTFQLAQASQAKGVKSC